MKDKQSGQNFELLEFVVQIRRTTKVVAGGRKFRFSATVVVGDGKGKVGVGVGKGSEVPDAVSKAKQEAKKGMVSVLLRGNTLQHVVKSSYGAAQVYMMPATEGTGIIAGGGMRAVLEALGVENVLAKCIGSTNSINVIRATIKGLQMMETPYTVARRRKLSVPQVFGQAAKG